MNTPALLPNLPDAATTDLGMPYSSLEFRQHQMFPRLSAHEIASLRRFAQPMSFKAGELIFETGRVALGLFVLLHGRVRIHSRDSFGRSTLITEHDDGHFMAEMAQLSGKPALIDGVALTDCETLVVSPEKLRALIVADAQLGEHIMRALILRRLGLIEQGLGPIIVGNGDDARLVRLQGFLRRNAYPAMVIDARHDTEAVTLLSDITTGPDDFPLVFCPNGSVLRAPDEAQLASCLGLVPTFERSHVYDVAIVGAGPAGLAAAVYAATEGLSVAVFDQRAPGGQAGASSRIENYLGFPTGISGQALAARAFQQALKFGAHLAIPGKVMNVDTQDGAYALTLMDGQRVCTRTLVVASGAAYRKPIVADFDRYEGRGTYYWASPIEAKLVKGQDIVLMGGGNSAGQATVFLANFARSIRVLIRGADLNASMSKYLIDRIGSLPNVSVCTRCTLKALEGDEAGLTQVHIRREDEGDEVIDTRHLFLFIGADPKTDWLTSSGVELDSRGFVVTGFARRTQTHVDTGIHYPLETSLPGMFAVGDVRSESTKRVASAVGDGAAVVSQIHAYLAQYNMAAQNI
ncbi:FAD-dependent oxidoreductase [Paraburkholderia sabiae]|uniref:FAD-dependent oxidoreductase n=1 Tax=Paraburkholderia sabiae TaxID=273251 RepID=A0ABU9Q8A8_9BURK|nr:FAD-dependent oxidoreductase [Paraburkholderia sabiae]WJZ77733.1 FAD-dependent oxidoreductase [Paraburkholderia sabiae]CAD6532833.1 Ferredoxin--NADP reductase [Paraburkholderia sabiae]CAG9234371.1 Thioredoxin reductase [Paraburkholderia sabiae]